MNWACYDLYRAGALDRPVKGKYQINERGGKILKEGPEVLTRTYLSQQSDAFAKFLTPQVKSGTETPTLTTTDNSKRASYMAKDVLVMKHGKKILEDGDRKKSQTGAEKIAGSGDV